MAVIEYQSKRSTILGLEYGWCRCRARSGISKAAWDDNSHKFASAARSSTGLPHWMARMI